MIWTRSRTKALFAGALSIVGLAACFILLPKLSVDASLQQLFPNAASGTDVEAYKHFLDFEEAFGTDDTLLAVVFDRSSDTVLSPVGIKALDRIHETLEHQSGSVEAVVSIANLPDVEIRRFQPVFTWRLPSDARTKNLEKEQYEQILSDPLARNGLLSKDGKAAACWVLLDPELRASSEYLNQVKELASGIVAAAGSDPSIEVFVTGFPLIHAATSDALWHDAWRIILGAIGIIAAVAAVGRIPAKLLLAFLMSWPPVIALLAGLAVLTNQNLHIFSIAAPPVLLIVSAASFVHLAKSLARHDGRPRLKSTLVACACSTVTTAIAFGALATSSLSPLRQLGVEVALGSLVAFVFQTSFLWAFDIQAPLNNKERKWLTLGVPDWKSLALVAPLSLPWFLWMPSRFAMEPDFFELLPAGHPQATAAARVQETFDSETAFEVILELDEEEAKEQLADPDFLLRLVAFEEALGQVAGERIPSFLSPATLVKYMSFKADPGKEFEATDKGAAACAVVMRGILNPDLMALLPEAETGARDAMLRMSQQLISQDHTQLRFGGRVAGLSPAEVLGLKRELEEDVLTEEHIQDEIGLDGASGYVTGYAVLVSEASSEVLTTLWRSIAIVAGLLGALLFLIIRSIRIWALAILTNALALSSLFTALWAIGVSIDLYSSILLSTVFAVLVDDSVHFLVTYRSLLGRTPTPVEDAIAAVGGAITLSSIALASGFALLLLSDTPTLRQYSWAAVLAIALAWFWDARFLPWALQHVHKPRGTRSFEGMGTP